jgi:hypothetical protein
MADPTKIYILRNVEDYSGTPSNGDLMRYNASAGHWEPYALGDLSIDDLGDVVLSGSQAGDLLRFNGTYWVNVAKLAYILNEIVDVNITSPADKALLQYQQSSGSWIDGGLNLDDLLNVTASGPSEGMGIYWSTDHWEASLGATSGSIAAQLLHVFSESVTGTGSNFDTNYEFVTGTLRVVWNGIRQSNSHFSEKPAKDGFTTQFTVVTGDELLVDYARPTSGSIGGVGNANALTIHGRNVSPQAPTDGQVLMWSSGSNWWYPATPA